MPEPIIQVSNLVKTYHTGEVEVQALRGINIDVPAGEMLAIMGPSGCGKTTFLNCVSGIDDVTSGNVVIEGTDLASLNDDRKTEYRAKRMGFIFQFYNLLPVLSAVENVELPLLVSGTAPAEARVQPALEFQGDLDDLLEQLGERGVLQVLVEGGPTVAGEFHRRGLVDHYVAYLAPVLFGGEDGRPMLAGPGAETMADVWRGAITDVRMVGGDVRVDLTPFAPSPVTGPVPVVRVGEVEPVRGPSDAEGGA